MLKEIFAASFHNNSGSNAERTAINNRRLILKTLATTPFISRSDLAEKCYLRKQTLTNIIKELLALELIIEGGKKIEGKGQPKKLLELNPNAVLSIGVHIDQEYIKTVSMNWKGDIRLQYTERLSDWSPQVAIEYIANMANDIIQQEKTFCKIIAGLGISLPNLLDNNLKNYHGLSGWEEWVNFPIKEKLAPKINLPIYIENDATACAFGHLNSEKFKSLSHFITLFIGYGLGGGIISNKTAMRGFWGNAGEIGRIRTTAGHFIEDNLSIRGLKKYLNMPFQEILDKKRLKKELANPNPNLQKWLCNAAADLSYLTHILENIFDPQTIILSGYLPQEILSELIEQASPLQDSISHRYGRQFERISLGYVQEGITAKGAAILPILL